MSETSIARIVRTNKYNEVEHDLKNYQAEICRYIFRRRRLKLNTKFCETEC